MAKAVIWIVAAALAVAACGGGGSGGTAATPEPAKSELLMDMTPSGQTQSVLTSAAPIADYLTKEIGTKVTARVPLSYAALVEDFTSNNADIGWTGALAYVAAHKRSGAEAVTKSARCAPTYTAATPAPGCTAVPTYPSIIYCGANANVAELKDGGDWSSLKGKKFAFGDPTSTSGSLWPKYYMLQNKIDPEKDFAKTASLSSQTAVALQVYNGIADCGAGFGDARLGAFKTAPDIFAKTKVVFKSPQEIPGDPQMVRKSLNPAQKDKVKAALRKMGTDPTIKPALDKLYNIAGMEPAQDADYNPVRTIANKVNPGSVDEVVASPTPTPVASPSKTP
jgi:phosphonate transport system substrate-binding protein